MGRFFNQVKLRQDRRFQDIVTSAAIYSAEAITNEPDDAERTAERKAMAREVIETDSHARSKFLQRMFLEASLNADFQNKAIHDGEVYANLIPDADYEWIMGYLWNKVMDAVKDAP